LDLENLERVRTGLAGTGIADLRFDANAAWTLVEAQSALEKLRSSGASSIEEPLPPRSWNECATLRRTAGVPIMLDESLCSLQDAVTAVESGACDMFNLRISKCGGVLGALRIAGYARAHGVGYQLGCMTGETGLLAALGRGFAAHVRDVRHYESAVPSRSLEQDLTDGHLDIEEGSRLTNCPSGPGVGVNVLPERLGRFTVRHFERTLAY
jgi:muconate cycloisomerase